jgi:hypothetical protein
MDAYVGAGILLDLFSSSAQPAKQQQPKPQAKPPAKPQQKAKQQQQLMQSKQMQVPTTHHHQQQQQVPLLPVVQTRPKIALILDLSGSPRHPDSTPAAATAPKGLASPVFGGLASPGSPSRPHQQQQRQVLHLGLPSTSQSFSMSPASSTHNHSLPPRPPRMPHYHAQSIASHHTYAQPQLQQQQQADLKPEHIQAALDVASKLGAALGSDSQAFARIMSFVSTNSNKPAALYQFMSATLAQIEGEGTGSPAAAGAAAGAAAPGKQQPRGLML